MANVYVRHGETYNGNGTASNAAAGTGLTGAYNSVLECLKQTAGYTVSAGDVVYIKTTNQATASFTVTQGVDVNMGHSVGATWIFDDGAIWPGAEGVVTLDITVSAANIFFVGENRFFGNNRWVCSNSADWGSSTAPFSCAGVFNDVTFDLYSTHAVSGAYFISSVGSNLLCKNCRFVIHSNPTLGGIRSANTSQIVFLGCKFEFNGIVALGSSIFNSADRGSTIIATGGSVSGTALTENESLIVTDIDAGCVITSGLVFPRVLKGQSSTYKNVINYCNGADGMMGSVISAGHFYITSRDDGNFPYLNAILPDSASTPWSYQLYPFGVTNTNPLFLLMGKLWTQASAIKTVTVNFLSHDLMGAPTTENCWIDVEYKNTTGESVKVSTFDPAGGALSEAVSGWSADTYGPANLTKRQLSITTPTAIAQDTVINITFFTSLVASSTDKVMFLCPDPVLS